MYTITLLGAGKIGEAITGLFSSSGRYKVRVCDIDLSRAKRVAALWDNTSAHAVDLSNEKNLSSLLKGADAVISALPFLCNVAVAKLASKLSVHYFDLTEDVATTDAIMKLSKGAKSVLMPQCGLAPGFISIVGNHLVKLFDSVESLKLRVGALPIYPSNRLKYNLTWSTEGLINEYIEPCEVLEDGEKIATLALEGYERFSLDGTEYEAFNTSGGLGSLCDTLSGKVHSLNYKSVRYPGHRDLIAFLMHDLGFAKDRDTLKQVFERSISFTPQDKVLIVVEAVGKIERRLTQRSYVSTVYNTKIHDYRFGAIQLTTASGICGAVDLLLTKKISQKGGFRTVEEIPLPLFLENEFGKYYKDEKALSAL